MYIIVYLGGVNVNFKEKILISKNKFLSILLGLVILTRGIVNAICSTPSDGLLYIIIGIVSTIVLFVLSKFLPKPEITMYIITIAIAATSIILMALHPSIVNYIMFLIAILFISIYDSIILISIESVIAVVCMIVFYVTSGSSLSKSWNTDTTAVLVVYAIGMCTCLLYKGYITSKMNAALSRISYENSTKQSKNDELLEKIKSSVSILTETTEKIHDSIKHAEGISEHMATASEDAASEATREVQSLEEIRELVNDGVEQLNNVKEASSFMKNCSTSTKDVVSNSAEMAINLSNEMVHLNTTMGEITTQMQSLCEENDKIFGILTTLNDITSQTNLLSLNASIEAARAGEQGKGFAVVAEQIRILADSSKSFTSEINSILKGVSGQTELITVKVLNQQQLLEGCNDNARILKESFEDVNNNTGLILEQSENVDDKATNLSNLFDSTLERINTISSSVETTAAAMEEITASIQELHGNICTVTGEFDEISSLAEELSEM